SFSTSCYISLSSARCLATNTYYTCSLFPSRPATTHISTLSLHDALPICTHDHPARRHRGAWAGDVQCLGHAKVRDHRVPAALNRSEEHTSELQSHLNLVCRLLLEKKNDQHSFETIDRGTNVYWSRDGQMR